MVLSFPYLNAAWLQISNAEIAMLGCCKFHCWEGKGNFGYTIEIQMILDTDSTLFFIAPS